MAKLFVYGVNARCPRDILEGEFARCGEVTDVYITEKGYANLFFSKIPKFVKPTQVLLTSIGFTNFNTTSAFVKK